MQVMSSPQRIALQWMVSQVYHKDWHIMDVTICTWLWEVKKVMTMSYAGDVLTSKDSFTVDGKPGIPSGLACDGCDHLYVAVMKFVWEVKKVMTMSYAGDVFAS